LDSQTICDQKEDYVILQKPCKDKKMKFNMNMKKSTMKMLHLKDFKKIDTIEGALAKMRKNNENSSVKLNNIISDIHEDVKSQPD